MLPTHESLPSHLRIISKRTRLEIPISQIHFIEVFDWKCIVHCDAGVQHETNVPLKDIQTRLPPEQFIRCNRSFLVNLDHVSSVEKDALITDDGAAVPISIRSTRQALPSDRSHFRPISLCVPGFPTSKKRQPYGCLF